jgi:flavin reductase (DIM6/NTAB) family NADH-FMN oxidoreductase RutF
MTIEAADFRRVMGQFASGVTVVTTRTLTGRPLGLTVSSFCSVSLTPPLVLVSIDRHSEAHLGLNESGVFSVSVLAEGQEHVSRRFATAGTGKFEGYSLLGHNGALLIPGALAHIECRVHGVHPGGDHLLYLGEVERLETSPGRPLLYHASAYHRLPGADA